MMDIFGFIFVIGLLTIIFAVGFAIGYVLRMIDIYRYHKEQRRSERRNRKR